MTNDIPGWTLRGRKYRAWVTVPRVVAEDVAREAEEEDKLVSEVLRERVSRKTGKGRKDHP